MGGGRSPAPSSGSATGPIGAVLDDVMNVITDWEFIS